MLSGSSPLAPFLSPAVEAFEEQPLAAIADSLVSTLSYWQFTELSPAQIPDLSLQQVASIPTVGWFSVLTPEARAAFTQPQVQALRVDLVRINLLTPQQVSWLTTTQVRSLAFWDFVYLSPAQTPLLTPAQIGTIPDTGSFAPWSAASRAALTQTQVQSLNVGAIRLEYLTAQQISWLTTPQIRTLDYFQYRYLSPTQITLLTPTQIGTIPDAGTFNMWSSASRAALTQVQIQALRAGPVRIELLTPQQVSWLTPAQVQTLTYWDFRFLSPGQVPSLTPAQVGSIPTAGIFGALSSASRAALTQPQIQALNVAIIPVDLLTSQQVGWLSAAQVRTLDFYAFRFLNASQTPLLTTAQIASIPDAGTITLWSAAARAALTFAQVQALNVATIPLNLFAAQQLEWLSTAQITTLTFYDFKFLTAAQILSLTPAQIASIPDVGIFGQWSAEARAALTLPQVQQFRASVIGLALLTASQRAWLTTPQIQSLTFSDFQYLNSGQTPSLTTAQVASIPSTASFAAWSSAARAALTLAQVPALNIVAVRLDYLTNQQVAWITVAQIRALDLYGFVRLNAAQTPYLTPAQLATIPDPGTFAQWSEAARAALTVDQVRALRVATVRLYLLTPLQVSWLTTAQIQSLDLYEFRYLNSAQIPLLTVAQIASIPNPGTLSTWSTTSLAALTQVQVQSLNIAEVRLYLLTTQQIGWLTVTQIQSLDHYELERLLPSQISSISAAQMAALPESYNLRKWSDAQMAQLTRSQILALPYTVAAYYISLQDELHPPTTYAPVGQGGHHDLDAPSAEANQVFNLVPLQAATHVTVGSGDWSNPAIWRNGVVPGQNARVVISASTNVRFDAFMNTAIFTLRVDGTLEFATNLNTQLKVDTVVVTTHGVLHIGTAAAPIADNVTARILIADNGPINTAWDPYLWSRGVVSRGELRIYGRAVTPFTTLAVQPAVGATTLTLSAIPVGWKVGDEIVVGGTNQYTDDFGADRVRIRAMNGTTITVDPLRYAHLTPPGQGLSIYVANLNRNVQFQAEDSSTTIERPHFAQIHNPDAVIENLGVYGFGRTDKNAPINSSVVVNGVLTPGTGTNPRARYAIHFHHTGVDPMVDPAIVRGSVVVGSPGWSYVNHSSNVVMENNVSFGALGAGFVTEDGNEIGVMRGNLAMNEIGSGDQLLARQGDHDFGHGGHGFWFQGPGVEVVGNISIGSRDAAFAYLTQSSKNLFDAVNLTDSWFAAGHAAVPVGTVPLKRFDGNLAVASKSGLEIWHHMTLMPDGQTLINNFTSWNSRYAGIDLLYAGNVVIMSPKLIGNEFFDGVGIATNRLTHDVTIYNPDISGFETGIDVPVRQNSSVYGGRISAVRAFYIEKGYDTYRTATIAGLTLVAPTAAQLRGRTYYQVYATAAYEFEYPAFLDRRVDSLLAQDVVHVSLNGGVSGQVYFYEQSSGYVPFPAAKATDYVPAGYLNKTNAQLRAEFGFSFGGELLPSTVTTVPGIYGYMKYR